MRFKYVLFLLLEELILGLTLYSRKKGKEVDGDETPEGVKTPSLVQKRRRSESDVYR